LGIAPERIQARGLGGLEPLVPFSDAVSAWKNRRVEFLLVRND
jgi:outer membrane protein OmpA-like peptidoglycan-associated protein